MAGVRENSWAEGSSGFNAKTQGRKDAKVSGGDSGKEKAGIKLSSTGSSGFNAETQSCREFLGHVRIPMRW